MTQWIKVPSPYLRILSSSPSTYMVETTNSHKLSFDTHTHTPFLKDFFCVYMCVNAQIVHVCTHDSEAKRRD